MRQKYLFFLVSLLFSFTFFTHAVPVFAQASGGQVDIICGIQEKDPAVFASKFIGCGTGVVGGIAVLFIIYGGIILMTSAGDPNKIRIGKEYVTYAIVGLLITIFTFAIIEIIGNKLHIPGIG